MKNKRILAALLSASMIFSSVPYTVFANSPNTSSESVSTTTDSSDSDEIKNDSETTDTVPSDSGNDDTSDTNDSTGDESVVSSSSTSSTIEKPEIEDVTFKIKEKDKIDKDGVIPLVYDKSVCDPSDLIQVDGAQDTDTVSYTINDETWKEPDAKTPFGVGEYKISVKVSRSGYQDLTETAAFSIKATDLDKEKYEKKFTAASVLYDGSAHELLTVSGLASDDVVSYVMDGKESDKIPSATEPGQYSITVKIKKGATEKEQANYNTLSLSFVATIERDVAADVQYASAVKTENNVLYYNQNAELTFSVTTKDFDSKLVNVMVSKDGGAYQNISGLTWEKKADSDLVYTAKYTISESGSYRFRISYQDVSGNAKTRYETSDNTLKKIVIDTDKPVIKLSYDKGDISDSASTPSFPYRRKATITVRDDNLTATPASINVQAVNVKDGSDVSDAYKIGAWQKSSDGTYTCEVSFQQDAKYSIQISAEDQSGNDSEVSDKFIIDTTNPKISISYDNNDSQNDSYFNNTRTMTMTVSDDEADYDTLSLPVTVNGNSVSMTLSGLQNGDYEQYGIVLKQFEKEQGKLVLSFGKTDNAVFDYTVSASVKDKAGNSSEAVTYADGTTGKEHFIIDKVKPVMSVSAQSAKTYLPLSVDEKNPSYAANSVTLSLGATDTYFDVSSVSVELTQTDANGETVHAYELPDLTSGWTQDGNTWNFTLPDFENDANYSLKFSCKDKSGNVSDTYGPYYFTVDQTAPTGQLSIFDGTDTSVFQKLSDTLRYWIFKQSPVTVNGTAEDATSGLSTAEYMVYAPDQTGDSFSGLTYEQLASIGADTWKPWTGSVTINASEKGFLYLKLTDKAGNVSFINTSDGIIVDDGTGMDVQITPQTDVPKNGVYKADVPFKINVTAPENDKTFTGIRHIDWRVATNGKTTQNGNYDSETDTDTNRAEILRQFSHSETVKSSLNNSNDVKVFVSVEDWAGNRKETSISLAIDTTNPKISASYDNNNVKNNLYFNTDRNMTLTVRERNFSEDDLVLPLRIGKNSVHVSMQDIRDGKYGLVMVSDRVDSEKNTSSDAYTDDRTNTYVIGFGHAADCDEDFEVSAQASDLAGNKTDQIQFADGDKATDAFTIDKMKPVIRITGKTESSSTLDLSTDKDAPAYSKELVTLSVSVTERNFKASDASESLTQTDINGKTVSAYTLPSLATGWTQKDDIHTFVLPDFAKDANYGYDFAYTDLAGNTAEAYPTQYFTVDKTAPEGYLSVTGQEGSTSVFRKLTQLLRYWFFGKDTITVTGEGEDETSGLSSVQYYIYSPEQNDSGNISGPTYDDLMKIDPSLWKTWTGSASIAQNQKGFLYLRMEDKAGNISFVNTSDGIIVNSQAKANVSIFVTPETSGSSDQIYADDVPLQISVEAPSDDALFAGIRHVEWKVTSAGKITQSGNYDSETDTDANRSQRLRSLNKKIIVSAAKNNSNNVVVQVTVEDWAGNTSTISTPLRIDVTKPVITASYDTNDVKNDKYFNTERNMTLTVRERNFSENDLVLPLQIGTNIVRVSMQDIRDGKYGLVMVSDRVDSEKNTSSDAYTDDRTNTYVIGFGHTEDCDEDFKVAVQVSDLAGNETNQIQFANGSKATDAFTIDKIKPVIRVTAKTESSPSWDLSTDKDAPAYSKESVTLSVSVTERNFGASGASESLTQTDVNGKTVSAYTLPSLAKGWTQTDNVHTFVLPDFAKDANYGYNFAYTDLAGNTAEVYPTQYFTVDKTAPEGSLSVSDKGESSLFDKLSDLIRYWFFDKDGVKITGSGKDQTSGLASVTSYLFNPESDESGEFSGPTYDELLQIDSSKWKPWTGFTTINKNEKGFLYLKLIDKAGNISFVNTSDGIIVDVDPDVDIQIIPQTDVPKNGVYKADVPFKINVTAPKDDKTFTGIRHIDWRVEANGKTTQSGNYDSETDTDTNRAAILRQFSHSEIVQSSLNNSNDIKIFVSVEDWAGNSKETSISLAIDTTDPEIAASYDNNNVKNKLYFNANRNMTLTVRERNFSENDLVLPLQIGTNIVRVSMQDIRDGKYGLVMVSDRVDSEENTSSNAYTDDRTNTYVIGFGHTEDCDEDFKVAAQVSDLAGNETDQIQFADGSKAADAFTIDKIKPVIRVTAKTESAPSWDLSTDKDAPAYSRESITLSVSVTERNFGADGASESLTQKDADGQTVSAYTLPNLATGWTQTDNIHTFVLPDFTKDANYGYDFTYTDLAGNAAAAYPTQYFTVDKTAPEGSLSVSDKGESSLFDKLSGLIRYWFFDKDSVKITGSSKDQTSGLASVTSYLFNPESDKSGEFSGPTYDELLQMDSANWKPWTGSTTINKNEKGFLYLRMEDKAGNISFVNTSDGVIVSSQANLSITVTPKAKPSSNGIYANDVPFQISVKAPDDDPLFTGIRYVKWQILKDGEVTQSGNYNDVTDGDTHRANRLRSLEKNEVVSAEKNNSNDVLVQVTAEDWAGNISSVSLPLSIDITKPTVTAAYDNNDARHEKYFNRQRDMTITVQDRNFNENDFTLPMQIGKDKVTVTMQDIRDGKYGLTMVSDRVDSEKNTSSNAYTDDRTNTYVIGFGHADNSDEDFQVSANVIDGAGNTCEDIAFAKGTNAPTIFTIDKIAPLLTIAASSNGTAISLSKDKKAPLYTRSDVTLTTIVDERNFDTNSTDFDLTQTDYNGKELSVYEKPDLTKGWKTDGSTHTLELPVFSNDANYGASFAYTDLAGNQAVAYPMHYFTIDKTVPTGTLTIHDDDATSLFDKLTEKIHFWIFRNHSISVEGKSEDATSGIRSVTYLIYDPGTEARDEFQGLSYTQLTAQTGWKPWNGSTSINPDQAGFVYLRMEDMAGNVAFINTSDGMIAETQVADQIQIRLLSDPTADGVYNSDVPFEISVTDPVSGNTYSGLRHVSWEITNGETVTQKGNYDSETDGNTNRSKRIASLTKRETVSAEKNNGNNIKIHVITEDWAGNKAEKTLPLIIDTTKPEISMSYDNHDVRNGKYYNKDRNMTLTIKERNFKESGVSLPIVVDGKSYNISMQDIRNGRLGLVMVSDARDSQSGFSKEEWTDDRTVTYIIGFGHASNTDDDYTVSASAEDMAANQNSKSGESFTIDKIAPVIAVSLTSASGILDLSTDAYNPAYSRSAVQAEVTIEERNFDGKDASTQVTQKNVEGKDLSVYSVPDVRSGWTSRNGANYYTFPTFSNDANYSLSLGYTDLAGNRAVAYTPHYFTVDQTAPVGSLTTGTKGESSIFNTLVNLIRFWFYSNTAIPVSGTYSDETAGIASASYLIYEPGENAKGTFAGLTTSELNSLGGWQSWNGSTIVAPDKGAFVYVKLVDRAGNVNYLNTSNGIVADDVAPSRINIELLATPSSQNIFNKDVPFRVTAVDPSSGGTYAGLKHVTWQVLNNGTVTQSGNFDNSLGDRSARVQSITGTATVEAARNNSNRVTIRVRTEDWAGNTAETTKDLAIDITKPKIEIIYDHNNPVNGKYYNQTRVATVRVTERNFDPSKVNLKITSTGQKPTISGWTISSQAGSSDNAVNTCTIAFSADADYTLNASVTDKAGNVSDYNRTDTFTIDQTRPKISVSYSGGNVRNGKYFDQKRTATITVTEHNFDPSQFRISVQAALDGKDIDKPVLSSWTSRGDTHTASITFLHDGDYSFTAETGDLAGNRSDKYTQSSFTIDTKAPELSFFDIKDHSANKDTVAPGIRSTDLNFDSSAVTLTLKGAKHKEKTVQGTVSETANGVSIKLPDFAHNKQTDDIYTLTARIQDKAGNVTEKSIVFSVNRYGSNFTYGKKTAERLDKYYLSKSSKLVIYETNVDQIVDSEIVVLKDGTSTTLKKGSDYTVDDESEMNGWHKYKYTISDHCFSEEGLYEIQIRTSDKAGNIQDNKIKNSPIRFVIDRTAPTAVVTGVVNNGRYKELSRKIYVQVTDNYAYGSVSLYLGDRKVKSFDAETVAKKDGKLSYTLKSANGWQRIRVEYNDLAGNHGNPVSMRVLVSASTWQQILYSEWFMPTIIAIFGGFVFLIILLLLRKRKKKKSAEKA